MPQPNKNEKKAEYISRAVKYMVEKEGLSQKHALGKAYGMWEQHLKNKNKRHLNYD